MSRERGAASLVLVVLAAASVAAGAEGEDVVRIPVQTERIGSGSLHFRFDLPEPGDWDVVLQVKLPGREPSVIQPPTLGGDVGAAVPGGPGKSIVWDAAADGRALTGEETGWVLASGVNVLPIFSEGPLEGMRFARVPAGSFYMGSPRNERYRDDNEWNLEIRTVEGFEMSATEVTQAQFEAVMGYDNSKINGENRPVERVEWSEAVAFCEKLGAMDPAHEYRLPTETEWEYACRAGTRAPYYWNRETAPLPEAGPPAGAIGVSPYGWHGDNSHGKSRDVGLKEPNAWGLFDMHGNVWEWCADPYVEAQAPQDVREEKRVIRGGSWRDPVGDCRAAARRGLKSTETKSSVGFRVVRTVAGAAPAAISTSAPPGNR